MPDEGNSTAAPPLDSHCLAGRHDWLLRAWHLALLRFALTRDDADRSGVIVIANEIDWLGRPRERVSSFSFFRRASRELCEAIVRQQKDDVIVTQYLAQIADARIHCAFAAALDVPEPKRNAIQKRIRSITLWRGLPTRSAH
jgi:hypothetical protein